MGLLLYKILLLKEAVLRARPMRDRVFPVLNNYIVQVDLIESCRTDRDFPVLG